MNQSLPYRFSVTASCFIGGIAFVLLSAMSGCTPSATEPDWVRAFGYSSADVHAIDVRDFGYPYVPVRVEDTRLLLPFDTGNMIGVSISSNLFDQLGLAIVDSYERVNSAGEPVGTLRVANSENISILGRDQGSTRVYELDHPTLPGLVGPSFVMGNHFTIDYKSRKMAIGTGRVPDAVRGFRQIPLVRSSRHPMLILVQGTVDGRAVLIELDTGKSRTVINPALVASMAWTRGPQGVEINSLRIGDLSFEVPNAKEVDQTAIDPSLTAPILAGVGSDILSKFVWTVDYQSGVLWVPTSR